ncbi:MAG: flavodoxin family protein [Ruminococcus sp.]|nr:flavodoxin family protein [Ruminococcus sp.]
MKILVLNGSPKKDKSDTMHMTRAFVDGMNSACENEVTVIDVIDRHIEFCTGCFQCKHNGGVCILDDDMTAIIDRFVTSDVVIFNFLLYAYGMPAPLKNLVDRLMPLSSWKMSRDEDGRYGHSTYRDLSALRYVMICGCGYPNAKHNFEGAVKQFLLKFPVNSTVITVPESPMFNIPQAANFVQPRLKALKEAGDEYADSFTIDEALYQEICSPMIPEEIYAAFANGERE